jgi:hypothetical protein
MEQPDKCDRSRTVVMTNARRASNTVEPCTDQTFDPDLNAILGHA